MRLGKFAKRLIEDFARGRRIGPCRRLDGHVTFKQAGRDQTGIVFLARDLTRSRDVGLKIILAEELTTGDRRKVRQQIAIAEKLANQRSVQICRTGQYQGLPYYTMVLLKLGKLAKPPGRGFGITPRRVVRFRGERRGAFGRSTR